LGIDLAGGTVSQHTEYLQVTAASAEEAIEHCAALVGRVRAEAGALPVVGVVAAVPGRIAPDDGRVLSAPNLDWTGVPLAGRLLDGMHGWAGEFGHTVVDPGGASCRCGRRGCLEAYVSYHSLRERAGLGPDVLIEDLVDALSRRSDRTEVIGMIGRSLGLAI